MASKSSKFSRFSSKIQKIPTIFKCTVKTDEGECVFKCRRYRQLAIHDELSHSCNFCGNVFYNLQNHQCSQSGGANNFPNTKNINIEPFYEGDFSLRGSILVYLYDIDDDDCIVANIFAKIYQPLYNLLAALIIHFEGVKISFRLIADMIEPEKGIREENTAIGSPFMTLSHKSFIERTILNSCSFIISSLNLFISNGSSWQIYSLKQLQVHVGEYQPLRARGFFKLPSKLKSRRGLINIRNKYEDCGILSILCSIYHKEILKKQYEIRKISKNFSTYKKLILQNDKTYSAYLNSLEYDKDLKGIGLCMQGIEDLEIKNNISVNVFKYNNDKDSIKIIKSSDSIKTRHANILVVENNSLYHYLSIIDFNSFMGKRSYKKKEYCLICFKMCSKNAFKNHKCGKNSIVKKFPKKNYVQFSKYDSLLLFPFCIYFYFDFIDVEAKSTTINKNIKKRIPVGVHILVMNEKGSEKDFFYKGEDCIEYFFEKIIEISQFYLKEIKITNKKCTPTLDEMKMHEKKTNCFVCNFYFSKENWKTLHHHHFNSNYLNSACNECNLKIKFLNSMPIMSLMSSTELKLILSKLTIKYFYDVYPLYRKNGEIVGINLKCKKSSNSNFNSFSMRILNLKNFLSDVSYSFIYSQYKNFLNNFTYNDNEASFFINSFKTYYLSSDNYFKKLKDFSKTKSFSNDEIFENKCKFFTLLLSSCFEDLRKIFYSEYNLDLACFYTISSFSKEASFFWHKKKIETITCPTIASVIESGIYGGVLQNSKKISISNTERNENFNPNKERKELFFFDIASNYSHALKQMLPVKNYQIMTELEINSFNFINPNYDSGYGYIFLLDLHINSKTAEMMSELPFPPQKTTLKYSLISNYQKKFLNNQFLENERLLLTVYDKEKTVQYYKFLSWMLKKGIEIKKVHMGIKFREQKIFESYTEYNLNQRSKAQNLVESQLRKSLSNNLVGKLLSDNSKFNRTKLVFNSIESKESLSKDSFKSFELINSNCTLFKFNKKSYTDYNLKIIGLVILSNAKLNLYSLVYDYLIGTFGDKLKIIYSHTDSVIGEYLDKDRDYIKKIKTLSEIFDFSNLALSHPLFSLENRGKSGVFKIQADFILEYVSIGTSQYSIILHEKWEKENNIIRAAGIPKTHHFLLKHEKLKNLVLNDIKGDKITVNKSKMSKNEILILEIECSYLNNINFTRYFISPEVSFPYGHPAIKEYENK